MLSQLLICLILVILVVTTVDSHKSFQKIIPNGDKVIHPCHSDKTWQGVGHYNQAGGGVRNAFGTDFNSAGKSWTRALCMKDSDGDGRTNGEELGDPTCIWTRGATPTRTVNITHPGVCEPFNSPACQARNKDFTNACKANKLVCNATRDPNVTTIDIRMKNTTISNKVTNYYCQAFALPNTTNQHLIAVEPIIDNTNVMHHILLFGCNSKPRDLAFSKPYECGMGGTGCSSIVAAWTLGSPGECFRESSGVLIGPSGYQYIVMQVHWNNPEMRTDYTDSSGMRFYLTPKLRNFNSAMFVMGQRYLEIQPGQSVFRQEAECTSACTKQLPHSLYFDGVLPHMHYAGRFSQITHYRNGTKLRDLVPYQQVAYDSPQPIFFDPPAELKPGDRLHMKCDYTTSKLKNVIYYGDATADEMCYGFFRYYPALTRGLPCINYGPIDLCTVNSRANGGTGRSPGRVGNCSNLGAFMAQSLPMVWQPLIDEFCDYSVDVCHPECKKIVQRLNQEVCWQGWSKKYIEFISTSKAASSVYLRTFRLAIAQCSMEIAREQGVSTTKDKPDKNGFTSDQQTILIGVGVAVCGLLLLTVTAIGLYRAFLLKPASTSTITTTTTTTGRANAYLPESQITGLEKGYNNPVMSDNYNTNTGNDLKTKL